MNNQPFISIIVPVYNGENIIGACLKSLLAQDYPKDKYEVIAVDNNSKDKTADIIKEYSVHYLFESKVQGSYAARNTGVRHAKGEILAFTDADCVADKGWLKKVGTEKESGNPERYVYEILPAGRKYYKKLLKQYFEKKLIHFDIDIVLMFLNSFSKEQKEQFVEERISIIKNKLDSIKEKIGAKKKAAGEKSNADILTYIEYHLKAEMSWLKSL